MLAAEGRDLCAALVPDRDAARAADRTNTEKYVYAREVGVHADVLRHGVADETAVPDVERPALGGLLSCAVCSGSPACARRLGGYEIDQIMYVQHVAAGEHARDGGLHVFVYDRAVRARVHLNIRAAAQLVFRDQTDRQQDRIAVEGHFGAWDRTAVRADLGNDDALHAVPALNVRNGVGEIKRNVKVIEALHDVSRQTAGIRHDLDAGEHLRALERHAARHDETDVARAENDDAPADHVALNIKVALCSAGGENTCRTGARDGDRAAGALAAAHREDDGLCLKGDGVEHINLDIYEGEIVTFLGPSGCGKTTILRTIGGFLDVTSGDITIDGQSIIGLPPEKRPTAMVFQSYNLWPHMTIYENLAFGLKLRKVPKAEIDADIKKMLALVSMSGCEKKYPNQMSGGQQQRIAIARSLLLKPSLLLLDEPFSALDAKIRQQMREELKKIQSDLGITVVFVTHDQEEAMSLSHRIVVMNKGKFEQIGTPTEIYDRPATRHVASFIGEMNFIDKGDKTIAVRPEDVTVSLDGSGDFTGTVRTIMVLGHYVVVNVQHGENVIKCFVDRDISEKLSVGQSVGMHIGKHTVFDK